MENLSRHTDEELVKLYVEGLNEAFDTLLIRYKDRLFGYILSNVHDEDIANDIFQETFFKVIVSLRKGRYVENGKFYVWLSSIAHNVIVDSFRKQQTQDNAFRGKEMEWMAADCLQNDVNERENNLSRNFCEVNALVSCLPEAQQDIVRMFYYQKMSFKEIAAAKSICLNTALGRMHYAICNMRKMAAKRRFEPYV